MQFTKGATVKFTNDKHCFAKIPKQWGITGDPPLHFEIIYGSNLKSCLTWAGETTNNEQEIELNGVFGVKLGLKDGDDVCVRYDKTATFSSCEKAYLEPASMDDWEIVNLNASKIESELMNQIKIIWSNLTFPIWVNKSVCVFVNVGETEPNTSPLILNRGTEIHIVPSNSVHSSSKSKNTDENRSDNDIDNQNTGFLSSIFKTIKRSVGYDDPESNANPYDANQIANFASSKPDIIQIQRDFEKVFRVTSVTDAFDYPNDISSVLYLNDIDIPLSFRDQINNRSFVASIKKVLSPYEKSESSSKKPLGLGGNSKTVSKDDDANSSVANKMSKDECDFETAIVQVRLLNFELLNQGGLIPGYAALNDGLRRQLGLEITSSIVIKSLNYEHSCLTVLKMRPLMSLPNSEESNTIQKFKSWIKSNTLDGPILVSKGTLVQLNLDKGKHDFILIPANNEVNETCEPYYYLTHNTAHGVNIEIGDKISPIYKPYDVRVPFKTLLDLDPQAYGRKLITLGGVETVGNDLVQFLTFSLGLTTLSKQLSEYPQFNTTLLCGPKGVGKSTLAKSICRELQDSKYRVYTQIIDCKQLRGKRADSIKKIWGGAFWEAAHRQPSIVLLEDLETAASRVSSPEQEASPDSLYFAKVAATLLSVLRYFRDSNVRITILATAKSTDSLHPLLSDTRGRHVFNNIFEITAPNLAQREEILKAIILNKTTISIRCVEGPGLAKIASKTEGYVTRDLETVVDRAIHFHAERVYDTELEKEEADGIMLLDSDFDKALTDFTPYSLHGVKLHNESLKDWNDVGGLSQAKKILEQTLTWPLKYPKLFSTCPLRPQSGLLLYGAPGTGKTLLASVVASQCQLNFISIKGPELLSKYIGASEQAVREVFTRAQSAKPCVIFFDEFDAIAPRRGHDSTGVTDRVVNQLLTQMDGVEALQGVFVLAATSRPDLIDPALLRPGRLDKRVNCPMPDTADREAILKALSRHLNLDPDVDLKVLAEETDYFSGADLQALLYTAHVDALNENLDKRLESIDDATSNKIQDNFVYFPSIKEGPKELSSEQKQKISDEVTVLVENMFGTHISEGHVKTRRKSGVTSTQIKMVHLRKALEETKPSVSPKERVRYQKIYEKFSKNATTTTSGSGFTDNDNEALLRNQKRVTLA